MTSKKLGVEEQMAVIRQGVVEIIPEEEPGASSSVPIREGVPLIIKQDSIPPHPTFTSDTRWGFANCDSSRIWDTPSCS